MEELVLANPQFLTSTCAVMEPVSWDIALSELDASSMDVLVLGSLCDALTQRQTRNVPSVVRLLLLIVHKTFTLRAVQSKTVIVLPIFDTLTSMVQQISSPRTLLHLCHVTC